MKHKNDKKVKNVKTYLTETNQTDQQRRKKTNQSTVLDLIFQQLTFAFQLKLIDMIP
jgi:hypothetical protein